MILYVFKRFSVNGINLNDEGGDVAKYADGVWNPYYGLRYFNVFT